MSVFPSDGGLLSLSQWLSPAFPVGGYAYSHGLEWLIGAGRVSGADDVADWLAGVLEFGAGWSDAVLLSMTLRATRPDADLAALADALAASRERLVEQRAQGRAFLAASNAIQPSAQDDLPLPVAVGVQARGLGLPVATAVALYLQAFAGNLTAVATRAVPLGQTEAQVLLAARQPLILRLAAAAQTVDADALGGAAFGGDLAAMLHETQETRIFQT